MKYVKYAVKHFIQMCLILLLATFVVFCIIRVANIDEVTVIGNARNITDATRNAIITQYHLDETTIQQYFRWLGGVFQGNLGDDYKYGKAVESLILPRIPVTLGLIVISTLITIVVALPMGILCAVRKNTKFDVGCSIVTLFLTSVPEFLLSLLAIILVSRIYPQYSFVGTYSNIQEYFGRILLPSVVMACGNIAFIMRITRSNMIGHLESNYVMAARAKGMSSFNVVFVHAFHNGCLPVLTILITMLGTSIASTILVEQIFSLSGIGSLLIEAVQTYNYPVVQVLMLIMLGVFMLLSYIVDMLYTVLDPRIEIS